MLKGRYNTEIYNRDLESAITTEVAYTIAQNKNIDKYIKVKLLQLDKTLEDESMDIIILFHYFCKFVAENYLNGNFGDDLYNVLEEKYDILWGLFVINFVEVG